jgi:hypothetical protein
MIASRVFGRSEISQIARVLVAGVSCLISLSGHAAPSSGGQSGIINTPSARIEPDGTWTLGYSYSRPYAAAYSDVVLFPNLAVTLSGFRIMNTPGFPDNPAYGDYKDKRADLKFRLFPEGEWMPEVAIGTQDFFGTRLFGAEYLVGSKRLGKSLDVSLGYGRHKLSGLGFSDTGVTAKHNRLEGIFGGIRYDLDDAWSLVLERDPIDYRTDPKADVTRIAERRSNTSVGVEYRWGWADVQVSRQGQEWGVNTSVRLPLNAREFIPKVTEPEPYTKITPRVSGAQWRSVRHHQLELRRALDAEEFGGVTVSFTDENVLRLEVGHPRISHMARAVGRAARVAMRLSPLDAHAIQITYRQGALPVATYTFNDLSKLRRYFNGQITRRELAGSVSIGFAEIGTVVAADHSAFDGFDEERDRPVVMTSTGDDEAGNFLAFRRRDAQMGLFELVPFKLGSVINDPSGFYQFQLYSELSWSKYLGERWYIDSGLNVRWFDTFNHSAIATNNSSRLPHVRTDVSNYIEGNRVHLDHLTVSRYFHIAPRWYGRLSGGVYEMMFSGAGGQVLYLPERGNWAADVSIDGVRQRNFSGWLSHREYSTVTALGALHYRFNNGVKATARVGKFLARDIGARVELSRRFGSGLEMGMWLTVTDNQDFTASGSQGKSYKDKGVFLKIPFEVMLPRDSRAKGTLALAEWNRDAGRLVESPGDLFDMLEKSIIDLRERDGLSRFGDVDDDYPLP